MIEIDGSLGEGGGQVLRTSLAMSLVTGQPFHIARIRARRKKPGLLNQHLTAVNAAAQVGHAEVSGNVMGSSELHFAPREIRPGSYHFVVGTAGSCSLVLQTILPALLTAESKSDLVLEGGTHNPMAPPFDFLSRSFLPILNRMGANVTASLERAGFYPAGGGQMTVPVEPARKLSRIDLLERGPVKRLSARALVANLPRAVAERELSLVSKELQLSGSSLRVEEVSNARGPGNILIIEIESENVTEILTGFGERGIRAEDVARRTVDEVREYLSAGVPVGKCLADQLLVPMILAGGGRFRTLAPTSHTRTNVDVLGRFYQANIALTQVRQSVWEIAVLDG